MTTVPVSLWRSILGADLGRLRKAAGITQAKAEEVSGIKGLTKHENGRHAPSLPGTRKLLELYGVTEGTDEWERLDKLARAARRKGPAPDPDDRIWPPLEERIVLEQAASDIAEYSPYLVPGLLQIEPYARAILSAGQVGRDVEQHLAVRLDRGPKFFNRTDNPNYWVIFREAALRELIGGKDTMRAQINHLIEVAHRDNVTIQVIPHNIGAHVALDNSFSMLKFRTLSPTYQVAYWDTLTSAHYERDERVIQEYEMALDRLRSVAKSAIESVTVMTRIAEELQ